MNNNASRTQYSPVICWTSSWNKDNTLKIKQINNESSNFQKALDKIMAERTWKR